MKQKYCIFKRQSTHDIIIAYNDPSNETDVDFCSFCLGSDPATYPCADTLCGKSDLLNSSSVFLLLDPSTDLSTDLSTDPLDLFVFSVPYQAMVFSGKSFHYSNHYLHSRLMNFVHAFSSSFFAFSSLSWTFSLVPFCNQVIHPLPR